MPESPSEQVKLTVTLVLFQPAAFGGGTWLPTTIGATLSVFTTSVPPPTLPTASRADDVFSRPAVFVVRLSVAGVGPLTTPDPASVAVHVIKTSVLFQPLLF